MWLNWVSSERILLRGLLLHALLWSQELPSSKPSIPVAELHKDTLFYDHTLLQWI